ncbi:MAG: DUF368 domain-containing protein [Ketobacter sp.]|nr:MAG: DUF368 domain-containing protein [Ketobacter sp.]
MEKPSKRELFLLYLKGVAMGAADIVPGVSGGTIAFITGIYQPLVGSIGAIGPKTVQTLFRDGPVAAWHSFNGNFLFVLMAGILTSVFTLSKLISYLLTEQAVLLWSFFFGLILISAVHVGRHITEWRVPEVLTLAGGALLAFGITTIAPTEIALNPITLFLSGSIAICAMVLPGISGSFILLLLGMYAHIIGAVKALDVVSLGIFASGCLVGLLLFTRLLSWLLTQFHNLTLALLTGFMIGSLNKVWPWKQTLSTRINSHGEAVPMDQANVLPDQFLMVTGQDPHLVYSLFLMAAAIALVLVVERLGGSKS